MPRVAQSAVKEPEDQGHCPLTVYPPSTRSARVPGVKVPEILALGFVPKTSSCASRE